MYKWILLGHLIGASTLFGGHVYMEGLMASANKAGDDSIYMTIMLRTAKTADRLMGPAGLITLVFGIWLVIDGAAWEFSQMFVSLGFLFVIAAFAIGLFVMRPKSQEIDAAIEEDGLTAEKAVSTMKSLGTLVHIQTAIVAVALVIMVFKPGL
ncbi:MAG: DUF2269 family protein [Acidimicrobiia bacterium]